MGDIHFCEVEKKMNDETLVSRMQIGDKDAFDEVYRKYRQQIMKISYLIHLLSYLGKFFANLVKVCEKTSFPH